jgi:hypothetical protein
VQRTRNLPPNSSFFLYFKYCINCISPIIIQIIQILRTLLEFHYSMGDNPIQADEGCLRISEQICLPSETSEVIEIENMTGEDGLIAGLRCRKFAERYCRQEENLDVRPRSSSPPPRKYVKTPHVHSRPQSNTDLSELAANLLLSVGLDDQITRLIPSPRGSCKHATSNFIDNSIDSPTSLSTVSTPLSKSGDRYREVTRTYPQQFLFCTIV